MAACEAVRALGNLTRCPRLAQLMVLAGTLQELIPVLQHRKCFWNNLYNTLCMSLAIRHWATHNYTVLSVSFGKARIAPKAE